MDTTKILLRELEKYPNIEKFIQAKTYYFKGYYDHLYVFCSCETTHLTIYNTRAEGITVQSYVHKRDDGALFTRSVTKQITSYRYTCSTCKRLLIVLTFQPPLFSYTI